MTLDSIITSLPAEVALMKVNKTCVRVIGQDGLVYMIIPAFDGVLVMKPNGYVVGQFRQVDQLAEWLQMLS